MKRQHPPLLIDSHSKDLQATRRHRIPAAVSISVESTLTVPKVRLCRCLPLSIEGLDKWKTVRYINEVACSAVETGGITGERTTFIH